MNEYETNPQRHVVTPGEEPSHRSADAPRDSTIPERGQSDLTAQQPPAGHPGTPYAAPTSAMPAAPASAAPASAAPASGGPVTAQQPGIGRPGEHPASPWQQAHPGQSQYASQAPYPGQHYPTQQFGGQTSYPGQPQHAGHVYGGQPQHTAHQQAAGHPAPDAWAGDSTPPSETSTMPAWAQPVGAEREPGRPGRGRKILVAGAAALLLALSAGGIGAATALALDDDGTAAITTRAGSSSVTRVVDRSSLAEIAAAVQDSVVSITTGSGEGSGVILTADGYVLTNNHVVANAQGGSVKVIFANGKTAAATIVGTDPRTDLAVLKATDVSGLSVAKFGDSSAMQVGDTVLALGSPLGLEGSVTAGIISAKDRTIRAGGGQQPDPFGEQQQQQQQGGTSLSGLLQTDAPINPGNSGGALVNVEGQVIGINSAIATNGGQSSGNIGLGFAIPSNKAEQVADQLMAGKKVSHPALGVSVAEAEGGGALVRLVTPNSAAAKAGIQQGDVITSVNGKSINDSDDLVGVVQSRSVGDTVQITYTRNGAQKTVNATLAEAS